jgi:acetolactate synthase-1/2/3 large subunit
MTDMHSSDEPSQAEYGSDHIVEMMVALGIDKAAFNPGASFRGLHDSLINSPMGESIDIIECTHEEISVAIAHGYAKASGKPMAAIVHNVVGLQHATMAIFNAWIDRIPVFVIGATGPMDSARRRPHIDWMHTANVQGNLVRDYTKFDDQPGSIEAVKDSMMRAWRTMVNSPQGPVYVCMDTEIQERAAPAGLTVPDVSKYVTTTRVAPEHAAIDALARAMLAARSPVILAGSTGRNPEAVPALVEVAELLGVPVVSNEERLSFPTSHPLDLRGAESELLPQSDFVLALDVADFTARTSQVNQVTHDIDPILPASATVARIGLADLSVRSWTHDFYAMVPADHDVVADTSVALPMLADALRRYSSDKHRSVAAGRTAAMGKRHEELRAAWKVQASARSADNPISLAYLTHEVGRLTEGLDWVLACHSFNPWPLRLWDFEDPRQLSSGSGGGGVGYGIGGAIGVALANRGNGKLMIGLQGDGDLLYCTSALWTIAQQKLPMLIVMQNNRSYYNSEEHQIVTAEHRGRKVERAGIGTQIVDPPVDFATVARGFGLYGEGPITDPTELWPALERALKVVQDTGTAALVDVVTSAR